MDLTKEVITTDSISESMGLTPERLGELKAKILESVKPLEKKSDILRKMIEIAENPEELAYITFDFGESIACANCPMKSLWV